MGIFFVSSLKEMFWTIDECTDAGACEYVWLPVNGGIMFLQAGAAALPTVLSDEDLEKGEPTKVSDYWAGARFTESWQEIFFSFDDEPKLEWKPCRGFSGAVLDE